MKRRFPFVAILGVAAPALALAGCEPGGNASDADGGTSPSASVSSPATPVPPDTGVQAPVGGARQVSEETDTFLFEFSYPQAAGELPSLAAWLDRRLDRQRQMLAREAAEAREEARDNGFPFNKYSSGTAWEIVTDLPGWLSMSANLDSYQGGAHPNYGFDTIVWDKENERALEPIDFFTSPAALDRALGARLCAALNAERAERRGQPVPEGSTDTFDTCVKPDETNLLLGSRNGRYFDRIGIQIAPYLAGPYAEGSYELTFSVDDELLAIVKPQYRAAFGAVD